MGRKNKHTSGKKQLVIWNATLRTTNTFVWEVTQVVSRLSAVFLLDILPRKNKLDAFISGKPRRLFWHDHFYFFPSVIKELCLWGKEQSNIPLVFSPSLSNWEEYISSFLCCVQLGFYKSGLWNQNSHWQRIRGRFKILEVVLKSWGILQKLYAFSCAELLPSSDLIFPAVDFPFILCDQPSPVGEITFLPLLKFCNSYSHSGTKMGHTLNPVYSRFTNLFPAFIMQMAVCKKTYLLDVNCSCLGSLSLYNMKPNVTTGQHLCFHLKIK